MPKGAQAKAKTVLPVPRPGFLQSRSRPAAPRRRPMTSANAIHLYGRVTAGFESRVDNARRSLGAEDQVLTDLIARDGLPIAVATLDTDMLHGETLMLIDDIRERYDIRVE